mmetsp:Transcript_114969/g.209168  ORF Transcript_114969/g.209168 Transcript_114969/m.209168 type:complete len:653 (+) Transcript_114969:112-2070(+)
MHRERASLPLVTILHCLRVAAAVSRTSLSARITRQAGNSDLDSCNFLHGVAAGDPLPDAIVLWTRSTPRSKSQESVRVRWRVWSPWRTPLQKPTPLHGAKPVAAGEVVTSASRDFTVKIDVSGLEPRVEYNYEFQCGATKSSMGSFHLPPPEDEQLDSLTYAIFSCANWRWGHFTAYGAAAASRRPLDFWLHVGDFIYENGADVYPTTEQAIRQSMDPPHETISLEDYRRRHALHRTDPHLQDLSAAAPLIAIWDDHEIANDAWKEGAQNHQSDEGDFQVRKISAMRAYHEWMPTRWNLLHKTEGPSDEEESIFMKWRNFSFGNLASMVLLDTRHTARTTSAVLTRGMVTKQLRDILSAEGNPMPKSWPGSKLERELLEFRAKVDAHRQAEDKHIVGPQQLAWLRQQAQEVSHRRVPWFLLAQPLVMQDMYPPDFMEAIRLATTANASDTVHRWTSALGDLSAGRKLEKAVQDTVLVPLAAGRYGINLNFDSWMGYVAERQRLLEALHVEAPTSAIVYGGDSHNAWAGVLRDKDGASVAVEFDGMSVSSPGVEYWRRWAPSDLETAAHQASNPTLLWANTEKRGFMLVELNHTAQHIEYLAVDTRFEASCATECLAAFTVSAGKDGFQASVCRNATAPLDVQHSFLRAGQRK